MTPLEWALGEVGTAEIGGPKDNPRIVWYHSFTTGQADDDETPWCSAFVNAAMFSCGIEGTRSAAARSWLKWGEKGQGKKGDVCILWRGSPDGWQGHVGFLAMDFHPSDSHIVMLGGNQGNRVTIARFSVLRILDFRVSA